MCRIDVIGEKFVYENFPLLFSRFQVLKCEWNTRIEDRPKAEGADIEAWAMFAQEGQAREQLNEALEGFLPSERLTGEVMPFDKLVKGPIEVKTSSFAQYIARRDNEFNVECGVISFAIWNHFSGEEPRARLGSLFRMFYPVNAEHERQPLAYATVFLNTDNVPYACLVFDDFPKLQKRLIEIGSERGIDLTREGALNIPCWRQLHGWSSPDEWIRQKTNENPRLWLKQQMWYIEMSEVIDLAKVVLIGNPPEIVDGFNGCSRTFQENRWNFLREHEWKTIPLITEEETKIEIKRREAIYNLMSIFPMRPEDG